MNIMDGMDAARFKSGNPDYTSEDKETKKEKEKEEQKKMPMVLRNLNNK